MPVGVEFYSFQGRKFAKKYVPRHLIFTAFLPQFIDVSASVNEQFFVLGTAFLLLEIGAIAIYALFGIYLRQWFTKPKMAKRFNKGCATLLAMSGANLLLSRQQ